MIRLLDNRMVLFNIMIRLLDKMKVLLDNRNLYLNKIRSGRRMCRGTRRINGKHDALPLVSASYGVLDINKIRRMGKVPSITSNSELLMGTLHFAHPTSGGVICLATTAILNKNSDGFIHSIHLSSGSSYYERFY